LVASVQIQLLALTLGLDPTAPRAQACNIIGFLGLAAEIAGTFFGAANAVKLQLRAQRGTQGLDRMEECKANLKVIMKYIARNSVHLPTSPLGTEDARGKAKRAPSDLSRTESDRGEDLEGPTLFSPPQTRPSLKTSHTDSSHNTTIHYNGVFHCNTFIHDGRYIQSNYATYVKTSTITHCKWEIVR
jgi:hypothetical protein